jgi:Predicted membrane protein (DUF2157)
MSERKLKAWQTAGLIDEATVASILKWEDENSRPWGIWALIGLGALAVGLGLISVIAANWDAIQGEVRIAIHFVLMIGFSAFVWWQRQGVKSEGTWFHDAMLFILGAMGLTFFGHTGQVYQTSSPLWQPLLAWLILFTPLLLGYGRSWLAALMWFVGVIGTAWAHASTNENLLSNAIGWYQDPNSRGALYWGLIVSPPMFVVAIATLLRTRTQRPDFWRKLEQMSFAMIIFGVSIAIAITHAVPDYVSRNGDSAILQQSAMIQTVLIALPAGVIWMTRKTKSGQAAAGILCVAAAMLMISGSIGSVGLLRAILFMLLWGSIAYGAIYAGWRRIFQIAIGVLALRLIILSFEFADDLLGSGVGLILAGIMTLVIAGIAIRISRKYAPQREALS